MAAKVYELSFKGEAGETVRAAFSELSITTARGRTVLRGCLSDQAALYSVIERIQDLGLELIDVRQVVETNGSESE